MKRFLTGLIIAGAIATARISHAMDQDAGTSPASILTLQGGARPMGMGGAFVAVSDDINAMYHNAAGLGYFKSSEAAATQFGGFDDFEISDLAVAIPLGDLTTSNVRSLGTILFNVATLDYGSGDAFTAGGASLGQLKARDKVYGVGFGKAFTDQFSVGAMARIFELQVFGEKASGTSIDVGGLFRAIPGYLNVGASARNLGANIQYAGKTEDSPTEIMGGVALMPAGDKLVLALDAGQAQDRGSVFRTGVEWRLASAFALRAGYDSSYDAGSGLTFGAGLLLLDFEVGFIPIDKIGLDYSFTPGDDVDTIHRVSLSARVGTQ